jgi:hypothetical protein
LQSHDFPSFRLLFAAKKNTHLPRARLIKKRRYYSIKLSATEERIVISISIAIVIFSVCARKSFHRAKNEREREKRRLDKIYSRLLRKSVG